MYRKISYMIDYVFKNCGSLFLRSFILKQYVLNAFMRPRSYDA